MIKQDKVLRDTKLTLFVAPSMETTTAAMEAFSMCLQYMKLY